MMCYDTVIMHDRDLTAVFSCIWMMCILFALSLASWLQIPTIGFLYVAGYIGHVGRTYLNAIKSEAKPVTKEIIIDVPMALGMAFKGFAWPAQVVGELRAGTLTADAKDITVSPR